VQLTDFENAAIVCFVVLLTRVILSYQLNFIIPISKVRITRRALRFRRYNNETEKRRSLFSGRRCLTVVIIYASPCVFCFAQVDENMSKAQKRSAALTEKFWFRKTITSAAKAASLDVDGSNTDAAAMYTSMSIDEIINGKVNRDANARAPNLPLSKFSSSGRADVGS